MSGAVRVYLETSVLSAYHFAKGDLLEATRRCFETCAKEGYLLSSSDITLREIDRASVSTQEKLHRLIEDFKVRLYAFTGEARRLADEYVRRGVIPATVRADAEHIAVCSVNAIEVLVSWNLRHIVNLRTRRMVQTINSEKGYVVPSIVRPDEVLASD